MSVSIIVPEEQIFYQKLDSERDNLFEEMKKIIPNDSYSEYAEEHESLVLKAYHEIVERHKRVPLIVSLVELIETNIFSTASELYSKYFDESYIVEVVDEIISTIEDHEDFVDFPEDYSSESAWNFVTSNELDSEVGETRIATIDDTAQEYIDSVSVKTIVKILKKNGYAINFPTHFFNDTYVESECYYRGQSIIEINSAQSVLFPELGIWQEDLLEFNGTGRYLLN